MDGTGERYTEAAVEVGVGEIALRQWPMLRLDGLGESDMNATVVFALHDCVDRIWSLGMQAIEKQLMMTGESGRLLFVKDPRVKSSGGGVGKPEKSKETESRDKQDVDAGVRKGESHDSAD